MRNGHCTLVAHDSTGYAARLSHVFLPGKGGLVRWECGWCGWEAVAAERNPMRRSDAASAVEKENPSPSTRHGKASSKPGILTSGASRGDGDGVPSTHVASAHASNVSAASADAESHSIPPPRAAVAPQPRAVGEQRPLGQAPQCPQTHVHVRASEVGGSGARDLQRLPRPTCEAAF
jgi:hypothetical protein